MNSDDGRGWRPEAAALDLNTEYYASGIPQVNGLNPSPAPSVAGGRWH